MANLRSKDCNFISRDYFASIVYRLIKHINRIQAFEETSTSLQNQHMKIAENARQYVSRSRH